MQNRKVRMSKTRAIYFVRFFGRIVVLILMNLAYFFKRDIFNIADGFNFFKEFSPLHLLWGVWMIDMVMQLIPVKAHISIGSQKVFESLFRPIKGKINKESLKEYIRNATASAYIVMVVWILMTVTLVVLRVMGIVDNAILVMISAWFYVFDLICVLIWCPFRLLIGNKCCTTCRIFNWDHLMMFLPVLAVNSFFSWTLVALAFIIWLVWELCVYFYPERFWENSNMALRCSECTDKLCTQYCRKLRK